MSDIIFVASHSITPWSFILLRPTLLDWAFDEWGTAGGITVTLVIIAVAFFLDKKLKLTEKAEEESASQNTLDDTSPPDSPPPSDEE